MASEWQKGGLRYAKLKEVVPAYVAPASVKFFFVAVRSAGGAVRLANPFSPLQKEYLFVATPDEFLVLSLKRPGVFRASIKGVEYRAPIQEASLRMQDGRVLVADASYRPIAFHDQDARDLVRYVEDQIGA